MAEVRTAIVTGAGSGIGRATAIQLVREGYRVLMTGRDVDKLRETAEAAKSDPSTIAMVPADLLDPPAAQMLVDCALERFGRIDALCNVAGYAQLCSLDQVSDEHWRKTIDTNLTAVVRLTRAAWDAFRRQSGGAVVNVSSMASIDPFPGLGAYAAAKAALNMFTLVTAREGQPIGVRAVAIAPGAVETPMLRSAFDEQMIPRDQTLPPEQVARLICDCLTARRRFEPGEVITILPDGASGAPAA